jgi:hypothetical protein
VNYSGLKVFDADGRKLSARFERRDDETVRLRFDDTGTRYPITIDPIAQQAYLKASNARLGELFGASVAISGDTAVVGARFEDSDATGVNGDQTNTNAPSSGAAYVFVRTGSGWSQQAYLKASNTDGVGIGDQFGCSVSVSGDTLVVGALFEGSDATGVDGDQTNNNAAQSGAAYVFVRNGSTWRQQAYLKASNTNAPDQFGSRVALSGDTLVIGAPGESSNATGVDGDQTNNNAAQSGAAYVFVRSDTVWSQQVYLKASNTGGGDRFGSSVAISTDTIVVGASGEDSDAKGVDGDQSDNSALDSGAAYVFVRNGGAWNQQAYLKASNADPGDMFGAVAISGNTVVVGAVSEDSNATGVDGDQSDNSTLDSGAAYVFVRSDTIWSQQAYLKAFNTGAGDSFGSSVGISRNIVVVVAMFEDSNATGVDGDDTNNSTLDSGAAYVIVRSGSTWIPKAYLKASNTGAEDRFGTSVAAAGSTIVVGAISEDSNATGVNGDEVNESASFAGAAYVFTIDAPDFHPPIDYEIVSRNSGKCLDVSYASTEAVASVIQWICHGGANQQWRLEPVGDGAFRIIARHSGQVLDVYGGFVDDVTPVIQYPWHGGDNQLWTLEPTSNGYVFLVAQHSGKVLDVEYASPDDGARVIQYTLHGGANQQWLLHAVAPAADPMSTVSEREP